MLLKSKSSREVEPFAQYKNRVSVTDTLISEIESIVIFCHIPEDVIFIKGFRA